MNGPSGEQLIEGLTRGDPRCVARAITLVENRAPGSERIQEVIYSRTGKAQIVGVTGPPGAGKSTLVDQLAAGARKEGRRVAILAVDPSSPFSGGAILGDRIRMSKAAEDRTVFIRSMATRGALGGISRATLEAVLVLDAAGFDLILIETVGVGQAEVDIIRLADTCIVTLVPGMGDTVQAFKAGILEIADLFVINKSDRDGADLLQKDLRMLVSLSPHDEQSWLPPILRTIATTGEGCTDVLGELAKHRAWLSNSPAGEERRRLVMRATLVKLAHETVLEQLLSGKENELNRLADECLARRTTPFHAVKSLLGITL